MRNFCSMMCMLVLLTSCTNKKATNSEEQSTAQVVKVDFKPDIKIGLISLLNSINVDDYLGENVMSRLDKFPIPCASVVCNKGKQRLSVYFHPGNMTKEFSEFEISFIDEKTNKDLLTRDKEFKTESGIKLGLNMENLMSIKGEPHNTTVNDNRTVLHYKITDFKNSAFLSKYNMPIYYSDYEFENDFLIKFKFGFEYP